MDKSVRMYKKALVSFQEGKIEQSMELCEKCISSSMKNTAAVNLKGLLYYLMGDLESAKSMWRLNLEINKDGISKKYLQDSKNDDIKQELYNAALQASNGLNIRQAIELLMQCTESDYNCINVNNLLTSCYIKVGEYEKAIQCINKVFVVHKRNKIALDNSNILISIGIIKKKANYKRMLLWTATGAITIMLGGFVFLGINKFTLNSNKTSKKVFATSVNNQKGQNDLKGKSEKKESVKINNGKEIADNYQQQPFPSEDMNKCIKDNNFEQLYKYTIEWKDKELSINEKSLLSKGEELLKSQGINYFYNKGLDSFNKEDYVKGAVYFSDAADVGKDSELYPHIIYTLAVDLEKNENIQGAIQYYEEYLTKYPEGIYSEETLYALANIYKPLDINKSKAYAEKLVEKYPKSMYNNSNIKDILKGK